MLPKAWRFSENDGIYLYKGGSSGAANTGNKPCSEFYACQIVQVMGLNVVSYDLENWKGILSSKYKLFTDMDNAFKEKYFQRPQKSVLEAYATFGWHKYTSDEDVVIGLDHFGASAPGNVLYKEFGLIAENVVKNAMEN